MVSVAGAKQQRGCKLSPKEGAQFRKLLRWSDACRLLKHNPPSSVNQYCQLRGRFFAAATKAKGHAKEDENKKNDAHDEPESIARRHSEVTK